MPIAQLDRALVYGTNGDKAIVQERREQCLTQLKEITYAYHLLQETSDDFL
jgi:hypothetical protein